MYVTWLWIIYNNNNNNNNDNHDDDEDDDDDDNNNDDDDDNNNNNNNNNNNRIQRRNSRLFTTSSLRHEPSPTRTLKWPGRDRVQIKCNTPSAYHVQHVVLRATWYEGTAQLLNLTEFEITFILASFCWLDEGGKETEVPGKKTLTTSFRKCHILQREDSNPKRDSNPRNSIGGRLGKHTC